MSGKRWGRKGASSGPAVHRNGGLARAAVLLSLVGAGVWMFVGCAGEGGTVYFEPVPTATAPDITVAPPTAPAEEKPAVTGGEITVTAPEPIAELPKITAPAPRPAAAAKPPAPAAKKPPAPVVVTEPVKAPPEPRLATEETKPAAEAPAEEPAVKRPTAKERREARARLERERLAKLHPPEEKVWIVADFKGEQTKWRVEKWDNPGEGSVVEKDGVKWFKVVTTGGDKDKVAIGANVRLDLSSRDAITVDLDNATEGVVKFALAIRTKEWFETEPVDLAPGANLGVAFDLHSKKFKAASTGWKFTAALAAPESATGVWLLIYTKKAGEFYIGNVCAVRKGE